MNILKRLFGRDKLQLDKEAIMPKYKPVAKLEDTQPDKPEATVLQVDTHNSDINQLIQRNNAFACDLYQNLRQTTQGNLFFSPYSISAALAMTYAGARGDTAAQMAQILHFNPDQSSLHSTFAEVEAALNAVQKKSDIQLQVANSLWPQVGYPLLATFLALTKQYYSAAITPIDYSDREKACQEINTWVEEKTNDKIKDLLNPTLIDALTRLILVNAIYFKGNWASQFDPDFTEEGSFWVTADESITTPLMFQEQSFNYGQSGGLQILELPYSKQALSMIILLPKEIDGLSEVEHNLNIANLNRWLGGLRMTKVQVVLPRFKMDSSFCLDHTLQSMGMLNAFDVHKADFSGMTEHEDGLYIGAVIHQAFVELNEEGTEAAAATAVVMVGKSIDFSVINFKADHPFLFLIRDKQTDTILFMGRVQNP